VKLLAHLHLYPPRHNAGAEWYAHTVFRSLVSRGHEVVVGTREQEAYSFEGIEVVGYPTKDHYAWADVVFTHLDMTQNAVAASRRARKPLVHLVHNHAQLRFHRVRPEDAALVVFNSRWVQQAARWRGKRQVVIPPPVIAEQYRVSPGGRSGALTLLNLTEPKGAPTFFQLARRMPERRFLAIRGAYGHQITPGDVPNVEYRLNTPDVREVYRDTRLLLMPSSYESWGRVAIEAAASGIPTIAHPAPGLVESLSWAGIFADREDLAAWERAIRWLDESETYAEQSDRVLERSRELDPKADLDRFEEELLGVIREPGHDRAVARPSARRS